MTDKIRIATRQSPLAMWQARYIRSELLALHNDLEVELLPMTTRGDKILDTPLAKVGGKGLFVKELELALLEGRADIAVHSTKDVPMQLPDGLHLGIICEREQPLDALVRPQSAGQDLTLEALPKGSVVGTSSLRRQCQLRALRPDIEFRDLRGNVNTRLAKLDAGEFDAIVLAAAGLQRLDMAERISSLLAAEQVLPAVGQGALSIELRDDDRETMQRLAPLHHTESAHCVTAERAMNAALNGGCQVPIAGFARLMPALGSADPLLLSLEGRVGAIDGSQLLSASASGEDATELGNRVAAQLLEQGAEALLAAAYEGN